MSQSSWQIELECKQCGERNPSRFEICWSCGKSLSDAKRVESSEPLDGDEPAQTWRDFSKEFADRRVEWFELVAVVLATCGYYLIRHALYGRQEPTESTTTDQLLAIPSYLGWSFLLWILVRRDQNVRQPVPIRQCRWYRELLLALLIVLADWVLGFSVSTFATDLGLPSGKPEAFVELTTARAWTATAIGLLFSAIYQEVLFRVYVQSKIESLLNSGALAIIISAMLFTVIHGYSPRASLHVFVGGLMYGTIYHFNRRVPRLVLAHWWYNLLVTWLRQH